MKEIDPSDIVKKSFYSFEVDFETNEVYDSEIYPTEVEYEKVVWLYACNHKYPKDIVNSDKVGKWMLFLKPRFVNQAWDKIKSGIEEGKLWLSKVSTNNGSRLHAIMIYTKDYTDLEDVIRVLNYLERTRLKPQHINIRYKANWQTRSGIYSGGKERPSIYASETIRELGNRDVSQSANVVATSATAPPEIISASAITLETSALMTTMSNMSIDASTERASSVTVDIVSNTAILRGRRQQVCKFFNGAPGSCNKGGACKFLHTAGKADI